MTQTTHIFTALEAVEKMTQQNEYRLAMEMIEDYIDDTDSIIKSWKLSDPNKNIEKWNRKHSKLKTIRRALLIAQRLEQEPSEEMSMIGIRERHRQDEHIESDTGFLFKLMAYQLKAEVDQELEGK